MARGKLNATNCYFSGVVEGSGYTQCGGFFGNGDLNAENCFFDGLLIIGGGSLGGGIVGSFSNGTIRNCYTRVRFSRIWRRYSWKL